MIKGVAFDLEGPLVEFEREGHHKAHLLAAKDARVELTLDEAFKKIPNLIGGPSEKIAEQIHALSDGRLNPKEILERQRMYFRELFNKLTHIDTRPGFLTALAEIRGWGLETTIGSSTSLNEAWFYILNSGLDKQFEPERIVLVEPGSTIRHKPHPDIFLETAKRMSIKPEEQLVVEDSVRGVQAAIAAGSPVIGLTVYKHPRAIIPLLEAGAIRVFVDWREINIPALIRNLNEEV